MIGSMVAVGDARETGNVGIQFEYDFDFDSNDYFANRFKWTKHAIEIQIRRNDCSSYHRLHI